MLAWSHFFKDNIFLKQFYSNLYNHIDGEYKVEVGSYLTTLNRILTQGLPCVHKYMIYHSNGIPEARSWKTTENEWTCWLAYCLPTYLPSDYLSSYAGDNGPQCDYLISCSGPIPISICQICTYFKEHLTSFLVKGRS